MATKALIKIGRRIHEARESAGYTNAESFAQALGVGYRTVQRWESGQITPSVEKLARIARLTSVPVDYLVSGVKKQKAA